MHTGSNQWTAGFGLLLFLNRVMNEASPGFFQSYADVPASRRIGNYLWRTTSNKLFASQASYNNHSVDRIDGSQIGV